MSKIILDRNFPILLPRILARECLMEVFLHEFYLKVANVNFTEKEIENYTRIPNKMKTIRSLINGDNIPVTIPVIMTMRGDLELRFVTKAITRIPKIVLVGISTISKYTKRKKTGRASPAYP